MSLAMAPGMNRWMVLILPMLLLAPAALADPGDPFVAGLGIGEQAPDVPTRRYGHQIALADSIAATSIGAGVLLVVPCAIAGIHGSRDDDYNEVDGCVAPALISIYGGFGTYLLGGPIVHASHGQYGRGAISLGARLALPYFAASVAEAADLDDSEQAWLVVGGAVTAMALDWFVLAEKEIKKPQGFAIAPIVAPTREGATVGLGGRF